jgi:hypothetical protein
MNAFPQLVLLIAGLVPVLYFGALVAWQVSALFQAGAWVPLPVTFLFTEHSLLAAGKAAPVLPFIPELPWAAGKAVAAILDRVHVGLIPALAGLAIMALAVLRLRRQMAVIRVQKQWNEDRLRRAQDYREDRPLDRLDGRREPFMRLGG